MIFEHTDYRAYLKRALAEMIGRNPAYSLRALAAQLGVTHSALSHVLSGRRNLSQEAATKIAKRLKLDARETDYLCLLVQAETAKNPEFREVVLEKISAMNGRRPTRDLAIEHFHVIGDWYHFALWALLEVEGQEHDPRSLAKRLGITPLEAETALERLLNLEMIERDPADSNRWVRTQDYVMASSSSANQALRRYHRQMLEKANDSLETQTPQEKYIGSETFAVDAECLEEAREITEEYFTKMLKLNQRKRPKAEVYHLGVQFFRLTKENPKGKKK